jgi:hypothetical protein
MPTARGLFDDSDSGHRQREGVHRLPEKLIGTASVRELLSWLGWVDAITGLEEKIRRTSEASTCGWMFAAG